MPAKTQRKSETRVRPEFNWDDARVLLAVARKRTLRAAAQVLEVNASTIGRRLDALENAFGIRLFERTSDGLLLTAEAEQLLAHAERIEQAAIGLASAVDGLEHKPEGVVRITAPPGVADHFIAPALPRLLERFPGLAIELDSSIGYSDLTRGEADIALRTLRPTSGDLVTTRFCSERDTIVGSEDYVRSLGTLSDPNAARWLSWGADLSQYPSARFVTEHVAPKQVVLRSSSIHALLAAAEAGLGVVLLPRSYLQLRPLAAAKLSAKLAAQVNGLPSLDLWLVGHRALRSVPRVAAVWDYMLEAAPR
jgi:DNA-binding transcriptional LysR family regulator